MDERADAMQVRTTFKYKLRLSPELEQGGRLLCAAAGIFTVLACKRVMMPDNNADMALLRLAGVPNCPRQSPSVHATPAPAANYT